jgi:hypothetical protein
MYGCLKRVLLTTVAGAAVFVLVANSLMAANQGSASGKDLVIGTWNLNASKSKFTPGPTPKSQTRVYEAHGDKVKATIKTVYPDGRTSVVDYEADYDSVEYPIIGIPGIDAIKLKRINDRKAEAILTHAGTEMGTAQRVISDDGTTMTITYTGVLQGQKVKNVAVYDKQK